MADKIVLKFQYFCSTTLGSSPTQAKFEKRNFDLKEQGQLQ